jgi:hypothetical protein
MKSDCRIDGDTVIDLAIVAGWIAAGSFLLSLVIA